MKLKKKYQLLLFAAIISVPLLLLGIGVLMSVIYNAVFKPQNDQTPFHASFAYPVMLVVFVLSLVLLAVLFSRSIRSLLNKINLLNRTIRHLASYDKIPSKIAVHGNDEMGELIRSVNLLIERTTYRELELKQQEDMQKELLHKLRHDINTPLTAVRLQLFDLECQTAKSPIFESLYQQIQYIADLTKEIHLQSTDHLESSYILNEDVNIRDLLETMVQKWGYLYSMHEIELRFQPVDEALIWSCNALWVQRLFDNILQNAMRHAKATMLEVTIEHGVVSIRDNGIGFNESQRRDEGMGLKIIADIARMLQIHYTLESNEQGTLFRLYQHSMELKKYD